MDNLSEPKKLKDCKTIVDYAYRHRYHDLKYHKEFLNIFKLELKQFYPNYIFGFDIVKFNDAIKCPEDKSVRAWVRRKYGKRAVELIEILLYHGEHNEKNESDGTKG